MHKAIAELPLPNRDTLAYLCAHWQRVASLAEVNKMPIGNLVSIKNNFYADNIYCTGKNTCSHSCRLCARPAHECGHGEYGADAAH
jgi:predicted metal-binding transcription factor (methanogenesis marker protein 9)